MNQQAAVQRSSAAVIPHNVSAKEIQIGNRGVELRTFADVLQFSEAIFKSGLAPKGIANAQAVVIMIQTGLEIGLTPMQAIQGMNVINGKVGIGGELALAIIRSHPSCEYIRSHTEGSGEFMKGICVSKRRGDKKENVSEFTVADARLAGLWNKRGKDNTTTPWVTYPKRMLMFRAVGSHGKDFWSDVLKGLGLSEENFDAENSQGAESRGSVAFGKILDVSTTREGALARAQVTMRDGAIFNCNGQDLIAKARIAQTSGADVEVTYREGQRGQDIIAIENTKAIIETDDPKNVEEAQEPIHEASFESATPSSEEPAASEAPARTPMNIGQLLTAFRPLGVMRAMIEAKWHKKVGDMTESDCAFLQDILEKISAGEPVTKHFGE